MFLLAAVCGASACEVKDRPLIEPFKNEPGDGKPDGSGGTGADVAMPSMLAQGAVCRPGVDVCNSGLSCLPTASAQARCCAACAANEVCSTAGTCTPRLRAQGEQCSAQLPCAGVLFCKAGAGGTNRCCTQDCAGGRLCSADGASCELLADGAQCASSADCSSAYCDIDEAICLPNPCQGALGGQYCGRGAQCNANAECVFTGRGMVSAGSAHTCAILSNGNVRCWGANEDGQLGSLSPAEQPAIGDSANETPNSLPDNFVSFGTLSDGRARRAVQVSAGNTFTCALLNDGAVRCWGDNSLNQLVPAKANGDIDLPFAAAQIDSGGGHSCALLKNGTASCWGANDFGQLGLGHINPVTAGPLAAISDLTRVAEVRTGGLHTCAVFADGDLQCWGNGSQGALGYASNAVRNAPSLNVNVGADVLSVSLGSRSTCAVITGGAVRCWGDNDDGALGYGHTTPIGLTENPDQASRVVLASGQTLGGNVPLGPGTVDQVEVDTGVGCVCARLGSTVRCWGDGNDGSLGYGNELVIGDDETPATAGDVQFGAGRTVVALADGARCAVFSDRTFVCWGYNTDGQIGYPALFPNGTGLLTPAGILATYGPVQVE